MDSHKSRYSRDDRKHLVQSIENLKNDEDYVAIFEILTSDRYVVYTPNSNGVFLNLSTVSDQTLDDIVKYLKKVNKKKSKQIDMEIDIIPTVPATKNNRTYKLSNYEKNILKQRNFKKVLNNESDYQELMLAPKRIAKKKLREEAL